MKSLPVLRLTVAALAAVTTTVTMTTAVRAQAARTIYIWDASGTGAGTVGAWGGGTAQVGRDFGADSGSFLTVTTHNFYEGARFDLKTPVDLAPYKQNGFWRLRVRLRSPFQMFNADGTMPPEFAEGMDFIDMGEEDPGTGEEVFAQTDERIAPFMRVAPQFGTMPQVGGPGTNPRAFPPGAGAQSGAMPAPDGGGFQGRRDWRRWMRDRMRSTGLSQMQLIVLLDKGALFGRVSLNSRARTDASGWQTVLLPVRDMNPTADASGLARRIILTGDKDATFALEQIAPAVETGRIVASIRTARDAPGAQITEVTVPPGRSTTFVADVEAGSSDVDVLWNFDADNTGSFPPPANMADPNAAAAEGAPEVAPEEVAPGEEGDEGAVMAGPRIDARGLTARPDWPNEEQNYRVEVTVHDRSGRKSDVKASLIVKVRS